MLGVVFALFNNQIGRSLTNHYSKKFTQVSAQQMKQNLSEEAIYDNAAVEALSVTDLLLNPPSKGKQAAIALISIPDVDIYLPIFQGVGGNVLMYGAGTIKENQSMGEGNYGLASHSVFDVYGRSLSDVLFDNLRNVQKGQKIYLTDKEKVFVYRVDRKYETGPKDVFSDNEGKKEITLMTCVAQDSLIRLIVQGTLEETGKYKDFASFFEVEVGE